MLVSINPFHLNGEIQEGKPQFMNISLTYHGGFGKSSLFICQPAEEDTVVSDLKCTGWIRKSPTYIGSHYFRWVDHF